MPDDVVIADALEDFLLLFLLLICCCSLLLLILLLRGGPLFWVVVVVVGLGLLFFFFLFFGTSVACRPMISLLFILISPFCSPFLHIFSSRDS